MPDQILTFHSWVRPGVSSLITTQAGGRAQAAASITLTEAGPDGAPGRTQTQPVAFLVAGPADVVSLQPGAIVRDGEGRVAAVWALDIAEGRVQAINSVVNPDKLEHLGEPADVRALLRSRGKR